MVNYFKIVVLFFVFLGISTKSDSKALFIQDAQPQQADSLVADNLVVDSLQVEERLSELESSLQDLSSGQIAISESVTSLSNQLNTYTSQNQNDWSLWLYILMLFVLILSLSAFWISYKFYQERRIIINGKDALVPEKWGKYLESVGSELNKFGNTINKRLTNVQKQTEENTQKIESMIETHMTLQNALDKKEAEIDRLKKGYDQEIFRRFLNRFARVDETLDELLKDEEVSKKDLDLLKWQLEDAFLECGLERFAPEVGEDYRKVEGVTDEPDTVITEDSDEEYKIAEVIDEGYVLKTENRKQFIKPAMVKVYKTNNN